MKIANVNMRYQSFTILLLLVICMFVLIGCTEKEEAEVEKEVDQEKQEDPIDIQPEPELVNEEEEAQKDTSEQDPLSEEIILGGEVIEEENRILVKGESNLVEGTVVTARLLYNPFNVFQSSTKAAKNEKVAVDQDGKFEMELLYEEYSNTDFLERFNGQDLEVEIYVTMTSNQPDEVKEIYGENGENLFGSFTYKYDRHDGLYQRLYAPIYITIGDENNIYGIETPNRVPIPEDYGNSNIWIETEVSNDHKFFYIQGKSNLLEGTSFIGGYYSDRDKMANGGHDNRTWVQPDGTFLLRVEYTSFLEDGFIWIRSSPGNSSHQAESILHEAYGENFELLEGEFVINNEKKDWNEIEIILFPPIPEIEAPEETDITEDDGELKVQVPDDVLFDFDKSDLKPNATVTLEEVITLLEPLDEGTKIQINGHTDSQGSADYNLELSESRAQAVEEYLTNNGSIDHLDIITKGYGEMKPIASNEDDEGRAKNRRVEIVINAKDD